MKKATIAATIAALTITLTSCANLETQPDQQGIRYSGGALFPEAIQFKNCQGPSKQEYGDAGDNTYAYPIGQRTFKFSTDPGSDSPPLTTSAPAPNGGQPLELIVSGTVTYTTNFANCDTLRRFHETVGLKYQAWTVDGWWRMMGVYIKDTVDRTIDAKSLEYDWVRLTNSGADKAAWERGVGEELPDLIGRQIGGEFFTVNSVILQRPELPGNVKAAIADTEAARQKAAAADVFKSTAATFPGGPAAYQAFLMQQSVTKAIESGWVKVIPIPQGSPVIVGQ